MSDLPVVRATEVIAALRRLGFFESGRRGSHVILRHVDGRWAPVPMHAGRDVEPGLLRMILGELSLTVDEFRSALRAQIAAS